MKKSKRVFHLYSDPGHAWIKVPISLLRDLNVADQVSSCSFIRGKYAYLEEDRDAEILCKALEEKGIEYTIRENHTDRVSRIRSYASYSSAYLDVLPIRRNEFIELEDGRRMDFVKPHGKNKFEVYHDGINYRMNAADIYHYLSPEEARSLLGRRKHDSKQRGVDHELLSSN